MSDERCEVCDRIKGERGCDTGKPWSYYMAACCGVAQAAGYKLDKATEDCENNRVDWRARALAAEADTANSIAVALGDWKIRRDHGIQGGDGCGVIVERIVAMIRSGAWKP